MQSAIQILSVCAFLSAVHSAPSPATIPKTWELCSKKSPEFSSCLKRSVNNVILELLPGKRELGLLPLDPLLISNLAVSQGTGPVSIDLRWKDLNIIGIKDIKINFFDVDVDNMVMSTQVTMPKLSLEGPYKINGKILVLPISGSGMSHIQLFKPKIGVKIIGQKVIKNKVTYMKAKEFKLDLGVEKLSINLENLFNGDKALGDNMNRVLNENWEIILQEMKPVVIEALSVVLSEVSNKIFTKYPYNEIFA